jgi:hypothetical protein
MSHHRSILFPLSQSGVPDPDDDDDDDIYLRPASYQ